MVNRTFKLVLKWGGGVIFFSIFLLGILWLVEAYATYQQLSKQLPTFANLQCSSIEVQKRRELNVTVDQEVVRNIINYCFGDSRDAWGNEIMFVTNPAREGSYLLISLGSDRKLDVPDPLFYFDKKPRNIIGQLDRDIIFRDGVAVTDAGKR